MKKQKRMQKAFGANEFGQIDWPVKMSNVRISRIVYGNESGCSRCFPHGYETRNSTISNRQRNWKRFRRTKWKSDRTTGFPAWDASNYADSKSGFLECDTLQRNWRE